MKQLFLIISLLSLLTSCDINIYTGDKNDDAPNLEDKPTETLFQREDLYGTWKITKAKFALDANMTEWEYEETYATFKENGLYEGEGHWGDGEGTYSISGNTITTLISNTPYITYEVISLTRSEAEIKATIVASSQNIWIQCEKVELTETTPDTEVGSETVITTFNDIKPFVSAVYIHLRDYMLYHHYIEYNAINNDRSKLTPSSEMISNAFAKGYKVVRLTNTVLKSLGSGGDFDWALACIAHFRCVRAFVYYNMVTLWGDIPYWTENDDSDATQRMSRTNDYVIINEEITSLNKISFNTEILDYGNLAFNSVTAKLLLTEMYLYINDTQKAKATLSEIDKAGNNSINTFNISLDNYTSSNDRYFNSYKGLICTNSGSTLDIYTTASQELYSTEANNQLSELPALWKSDSTAQYGYWSMLNRIGKTTEIIGCSKDETLMPIPLGEIIHNPNITQNPGYKNYEE